MTSNASKNIEAHFSSAFQGKMEMLYPCPNQIIFLFHVIFLEFFFL